MKTATVADLRNQFRRISSWIADGQTVEITRKGVPFAEIRPVNARKRRVKKPDFMARLHRIWGDRVFSAKEVQEMRDAEDEEGCM